MGRRHGCFQTKYCFLHRNHVCDEAWSKLMTQHLLLLLTFTLNQRYWQQCIQEISPLIQTIICSAVSFFLRLNKESDPSNSDASVSSFNAFVHKNSQWIVNMLICFIYVTMMWSILFGLVLSMSFMPWRTLDYDDFLTSLHLINYCILFVQFCVVVVKSLGQESCSWSRKRQKNKEVKKQDMKQ